MHTVLPIDLRCLVQQDPNEDEEGYELKWNDEVKEYALLHVAGSDVVNVGDDEAGELDDEDQEEDRGEHPHADQIRMPIC